jgi:hypothetical protein
MSTNYHKGQLIACPHCKKEQEEPVEEYVIPGSVGPASKYQSDCTWCYRDFTVEALADGHFVVEEA